MRNVSVFLFVATTQALSGCDPPCDRSGCAATDRPVASGAVARGIAGAVSSESDVIANGCQECVLSQATLEVWSATAPVATREQASALVGTVALHHVMVDERYELELGLGEYLACFGSACAALSLAGDGVTTVHFRAVYGPGSIVVFEPGDDAERESGLFDLPERG